jgi:hypothetical protein
MFQASARGYVRAGRAFGSETVLWLRRRSVHLGCYDNARLHNHRGHWEGVIIEVSRGRTCANLNNAFENPPAGALPPINAQPK